MIQVKYLLEWNIYFCSFCECGMGSIPTITTVTSKDINMAPYGDNMANQGFELVTLQGFLNNKHYWQVMQIKEECMTLLLYMFGAYFF